MCSVGLATGTGRGKQRPGIAGHSTLVSRSPSSCLHGANPNPHWDFSVNQGLRKTLEDLNQCPSCVHVSPIICKQPQYEVQDAFARLWSVVPTHFSFPFSNVISLRVSPCLAWLVLDKRHLKLLPESQSLLLRLVWKEN